MWWWTLIAALLVLAVAAIDARAAWRARESALALPLPVTPQRAPRADAERERALARALAQLDRPWPQMLLAVERVDVAGVAWLGLDLGEDGALRLEGLAADAPAALAAAEALRRQGRWRDVVLGRMEAAPDGSRRFELVASRPEPGR